MEYAHHFRRKCNQVHRWRCHAVYSLLAAVHTEAAKEIRSAWFEISRERLYHDRMSVCDARAHVSAEFTQEDRCLYTPRAIVVVVATGTN